MVIGVQPRKVKRSSNKKHKVISKSYQVKHIAGTWKMIPFFFQELDIVVEQFNVRKHPTKEAMLGAQFTPLCHMGL
jgi:hypothetical protein